MLKKRWAVSLLVMGAVGCSKVNLPRLGEAGTKGGTAQVSQHASRGPQSNDSAVVQALCHQLEQQYGQVPRRSVSEYKQLQTLLRSMSPLVQGDPSLQQRAHAAALKTTNDMIMQYLINARKVEEFRSFRNGLHRWMKPDKIHGTEEDLDVMIRAVLYVEEGSTCASFYLESFYTQYLRNIDLFGSIVFGSTNNPAQPDTLGLVVTVPDDIAKAAPVWDRTGSHGRALWLTLLKWEVSPALDSILQSLENRAHAVDENRAGLVLDLRYSGGASQAALVRVRDSAAKGWGNLPLILLTNRETRGMAAVFVSEMSGKPNVKVEGTSPELYGFGRKLKQQASTLANGVSEVNVTVGYELLQAPFDDPSHDGFRLHLRQENVLRFVNTDEVINEAYHLAQSDTSTPPETHDAQPAALPAQPPLNQSEGQPLQPAPQQPLPAQQLEAPAGQALAPGAEVAQAEPVQAQQQLPQAPAAEQPAVMTAPEGNL